MQCFVYNPRYGGEADAEKKILHFYPADTPLAEQVSSVGLCEAIAAFSATFSSEGCESLHTQNGRLLSWQVEPGFWIVLCMPHSPDKAPSKSNGSSSTASSSAQKPAAKEAVEEVLPPSEETLQDCSLLALLRKIYGALRLAVGPLADIAAACGADGLRSLLGEVMPLLLRVCVPAGEEDGRRLDLLGACPHAPTSAHASLARARCSLLHATEDRPTNRPPRAQTPSRA